MRLREFPLTSRVLRAYAGMLAGVLENSRWCERGWHGKGDCIVGKLIWFHRTGEWVERVAPVHGEGAA